MSAKIDIKPESELELVMCRLLDAPVEKVYKIWTDGKTYPEWFVQSLGVSLMLN